MSLGGGPKGTIGGTNAGGGFNLTGGGANAPFEYGPSPFDLSQISDAVGSNTQAIQNRYQQLGLGGSSMEGQDVTGAQDMGSALIGQEQTQTVTNPAINPALQPPINQLTGVQSAASGGVSLGTLASDAGKLATLAAGA
jgi:hypothetical protein